MIFENFLEKKNENYLRIGYIANFDTLLMYVEDCLLCTKSKESLICKRRKLRIRAAGYVDKNSFVP
jgi:hypothetical protein